MKRQKITVYTDNLEALDRFIVYLTEENVWNTVEKEGKTNKITMFPATVFQPKELERLQRVMENGLKAIEQIIEIEKSS